MKTISVTDTDGSTITLQTYWALLLFSSLIWRYGSDILCGWSKGKPNYVCKPMPRRTLPTYGNWVLYVLLCVFLFAVDGAGSVVWKCSYWAWWWWLCLQLSRRVCVSSPNPLLLLVCTMSQWWQVLPSQVGGSGRLSRQNPSSRPSVFLGEENPNSWQEVDRQPRAEEQPVYACTYPDFVCVPLPVWRWFPIVLFPCPTEPSVSDCLPTTVLRPMLGSRLAAYYYSIQLYSSPFWSTEWSSGRGRKAQNLTLITVWRRY